MLRIPLALACCMAAFSPVWGANFWLSSSGNMGAGSTPPTTMGAIPTITHPPSVTEGTFYIWARPTATKTLENWSLKVVSSNTNVVSFNASNTSSVDAFNPVLGNTGGPMPIPIVRWEFVDEPTGASLATDSLKGLNVFGVARSGKGIGPASDGVQQGMSPDLFDDPLYHPGTNAWLLASVNYTLHGVLDTAAIHLQIGEIGINHTGESSSLTNVVFGLTSDAALNANTQRSISSATADLHITVSNTNTPSADFDDDGDVDGRDFLTWQRGFGITNGALPSQGDANFDGAVNAADLGFWQTQYGQPPPLTALAVAVPEPATLLLMIVASIFCFHSKQS